MNLWIVTIGSSDVQLDSDKVNQDKERTEKQRSDKVWGYWYNDDLKAQYYDIAFEPKSLFKDKEESYRIAPRILGAVYNASSEQVQHEVLSYLTFPLLDNFVEALKQCPAPEAIAVLLTDQSAIFQDDHQRRKPKSPYWQDTYELESILQCYFEGNFPDIPCTWITLDPTSEDQRLDNWDQVLQLVQTKFSVNFPEELPKEAIVYVSHQAGTPAISSAVQFSSLAKFGDRVRFLVSSEQATQLPKILPSSAYLKGIRKQEAKKLLERHDYSGVESLLQDYPKDNDTTVLLEAAIQWNFAKFDEFAKKLQELSDREFACEVEERSQNWWWTAYEAAYLAIIRLDKQQDKDAVKDTLGALFHSFRAIEGLFTEWGIQHFRKHILIKNDRPYLQTTILDDEHYFNRVKYKEKDGKQVPDNDIAKLKDTVEDLKRRQKDIVFYGLTVYTLFREVRQDWKTRCKSINRFWDTNNGISEKRNNVFHQLRGLTENELFEIWEIASFDGWKERMREFANYVSDQTFELLDKEGSDGKVASLMVKVHEKLKSAIARL